MPWASRNGTPRRTSRSATSVAASISSAAAAASRSRLNATPPSIPVGGREAQLERVDGVEQGLLVLLHVLVVGQRQAVHHAVQRGQVADDPRRLGAQQLGGVGVLLLRHDRASRDAQASETSQKPNSSLDQSTISAPSRERCVAQVAAAAR